MKVKISELRKMIQEQYKEVLDHECVEDVEAVEDSWAGGENLVNKVDHEKAYKVIKETKSGKKIKVRKMRVNELKNLVLESVKNSHKRKINLNEIFGFGEHKWDQFKQQIGDHDAKKLLDFLNDPSNLESAKRNGYMPGGQAEASIQAKWKFKNVYSKTLKTKIWNVMTDNYTYAYYFDPTVHEWKVNGQQKYPI